MKNESADPCPLMERRYFISNTLKALGTFALLPYISTAHVLTDASKTYTVDDIMQLILKEIPGAPFKQTVDTLKSGNKEMIVTGIVTTMFSTIQVIEQALRLRANFIIAHEPTFYNHADDINYVAQNSEVKKKQALLLKHGITVWRFHDYWHACKPDGIQYGFMKKMDWLPYFKSREEPLILPPLSLENLAKQLKQKLGIEKLRIIGDPAQSCSRVAVMPGAWGGQNQMLLLETKKPDVLVVGELQEWETAEYIRDGRLMGGKTSLIVLGHAVSEEPGMEYLVEWLQPKLPGLTVTHLTSGNPFTWI
ncbi:Nif3-like dinuclear metal center hexameric protein [Pedobacter hartonius]|uniref:Putative GTP cyclohydrolase 1 type 2, NIF3 family n=1 Tax=Pedobacter hartonius TaxID=425514 RepID=A0A1H4BMV0_9SPHI|nr:Nif3-like dinuclear metal center hexameric protein [Pedobacter hartonius]SEA49407.1 Putative GTP cyclohydrolase 1 type 2, NIF3 family [Pedobacter hartonius]